ncbi:uncharacterized protein LOC118270486 [Spodoptera frugiperda]|uniref:Regulatory protein zeste n=1 Tax=Spodoptera frugiperda TaxID=7108 RepID=A0A9R0EYA3_SPOFR|nr:uncharacterized protein LOC118270486 [Spodoptera frugiperda]
MSRNAAPSLNQVEKLVYYMECNPWLAMGHARTSNARNRSRQAWTKITTVLNSEGDGCTKTWQQWCKYWKDKKGAVKRKASLIAAGTQRPGSSIEDLPELSEVELKIQTIMGEGSVGRQRKTTNGQRETTDSQRETTDSQRETTETFMGDRSLAIDPFPDRLPEPTKPVVQQDDVSERGSQTPTPRVSRETLRDRRRTIQLPPRLSGTRRRLLRRSPPVQRRSEMASITERFIAIEERRVDAELLIAQAIRQQAQSSQATAQAIGQIGQAIAQAINQQMLNGQATAQAMVQAGQAMAQALDRMSSSIRDLANK